MLSSLTIKNYKSIVDLTLELGSFNVFIGENGCGKTNILEALAMVAGAESDRLKNEELIARGIRIARDSLTANAFVGISRPLLDLNFSFSFAQPKKEKIYSKTLELTSGKGEWFESASSLMGGRTFWSGKKTPKDKDFPGMPLEEQKDIIARAEFNEALPNFGIYCASTLALRGLQTESHREPLGLFGEGLDVAISQLTAEQKTKLLKHAQMVSWLEDIDIDQSGQRKLAGYKPSRSRSNLYFTDKFLAEDNQIFSAENANEGILHVLFHLTLFLHADAPKLFAIDNIEAALNPHLLRHLIKALAQLAQEEKRQALVTTHNPAALDGLNLHDDEQRLFVVYRNEEGHTQARRIKVKPEADPKFKLSELWMRGMLGGIPEHF